MPNTIEIAKSGRATCRGCGKKIVKDLPRFGEEVPNVFAADAGTAFRYWHLPCAAVKLANELRDVLATVNIDIPEREALLVSIAAHAHPDYPYAELAPNGRAKCRVCHESVAKGQLRVVFERVVEASMGLTRGPGYVHAACTGQYPDAIALGQAPLIEALRSHSKLDETTVGEVVRALENAGEAGR
jgi:hypothetical protein